MRSTYDDFPMTSVGRLFFLDVSVGGRIVSANADGSDRTVIACVDSRAKEA